MKVLHILQSIVAVAITLFGFGNAMRCLFFTDYEYSADRFFFTTMLSLIGFAGIYLWIANQKECKAENDD